MSKVPGRGVGPAEDGGAAAAPVLQVLSGRPDDVEIAALVAVLVARAAAGRPEPAPVPRGAWGDPAVMLGGRPGSGGWRPLPGTRP